MVEGKKKGDMAAQQSKTDARVRREAKCTTKKPQHALDEAKKQTAGTRKLEKAEATRRDEKSVESLKLMLERLSSMQSVN